MDLEAIQVPQVQPASKVLQAPMEHLVIRATRVLLVNQEERDFQVPWVQMESKDRRDLPVQLVLWDHQELRDLMVQLEGPGPVALKGRKDLKERRALLEDQDHPGQSEQPEILADQAQMDSRVHQVPLETPEHPELLVLPGLVEVKDLPDHQGLPVQLELTVLPAPLELRVRLGRKDFLDLAVPSDQLDPRALREIQEPSVIPETPDNLEMSDHPVRQVHRVLLDSRVEPGRLDQLDRAV